ncbi:nuclear pore complex protein Nup214 isoform X2 [Scleropages formosus]|uniref:nuclear pore complex protein Nup214 isoform X2 n=1 Tax=Scleropages formosus TaxID=113540 RepID=UPI0010FA64BC|nr:nuclear pore complex protein Nup214 isoform X2 [Scleropages formosus]
MSDDPDPIPERDMKDFQFRQMKKIRVFDAPDDLPRERCSLLAVSNKFGLTFAGQERTLKMFHTKDVLLANKAEGNPNEIVEGVKALEVTVECPLHHLALSSDELTLSVCGVSEEGGLLLTFFDVRTFLNKARPEKLPFGSLRPAVDPGTLVQDLKWNPAQTSVLAVCLSDGSMMVLEVTDSVTVQAQLPASVGITCVCWSPKGKQVAAGKQNATVIQYTPALQEKKVIPCPHFYTSDNPVKVLDVLWLSTYVFAVVYAAADGSPETPPDLVVVSLPKKDDKKGERYLNFSDLVYGTCTERQHHYFLSHIEDWDLVLAASAASIEVSIIAKQEDKTSWELWLLEDASRAELPVTMNNDDTLPVGVAIDYTSQEEIRISDECVLPPAPTLMLLSTDGVLCPFSLLNQNPGVKQLSTAPVSLALEGERIPAPGSASMAPALCATAAPAATVAPTFASTLPTSAVGQLAPAATPSGFSFSLPSSLSAAPSMFSSTTPAAAAVQSTVSTGFLSAAQTIKMDLPAAPAFSFSATSIKPPVETSGAPPSSAQRPSTASPITSFKTPVEPATPAVKVNLNDRFLAVDTPAPTAPGPRDLFTSTPKPAFSAPNNHSVPLPSSSKATAAPVLVKQIQNSSAMPAVQKAGAASQSHSSVTQASLSMKAMEKQLQQRKDSDPVMAGILEEIAHFQKELDDLKARSDKADFTVGTVEEMKELRKESEDLHVFTIEIKETTESLHGDISTLKTTLLEGFAGAEEGKAQSELNKDRGYLQLLYKKPLDPRSEEQLKEIRRLYQYVKFAMEDVNDVLDLEWEKHLEKKKKHKHLIVPEREALFTTLANHLDIINQQKQKLDSLVKDLQALRLYNRPAAWSIPSHRPATPQSMDSELEVLRDTLMKASLETPPKAPSITPAKMSPVKQSQLRNFLCKRQTPPIRSTAPANLSRSAFLSPKYYEDLDDASSTSSLSQPLDPEDSHSLEEEESALAPSPGHAIVVPRHPTVVRTPSIQPGFRMQTAPFSKLPSGLSTAASPVPPSKINMGGADSTAFATKTVKHGAPPAEKTTPVTIPAQQAAATAALRRQMASQKPAGTSLTESTLKTVPQVVNVQELKVKGPALPVSMVIGSSVPAPATQVAQQVLATVTSNQAKRNQNLSASFKATGSTSESSSVAQPGFVFGGVPMPEVPACSASSSAPASAPTEQTSKAFSFSAAPPGGFNFSSLSTVSSALTSQGGGGKDVSQSKFSFNSTNATAGKLVFGGGTDTSFSFTPKPSSAALGGTNSTTPPASVSAEPARPVSSTPPMKMDFPASKPVGAGETLGSFSGLRVGQGDEETKELPKTTTSAASGFSFSTALGATATGVASFSFGSGFRLGKTTEPAASEAEPTTSTTTTTTGGNLPKATASIFESILTPSAVSAEGVFKPSDPTAPVTTKSAFSVAQPAAVTSASISFSSLLAAPLTSPNPEPPASLSETTTVADTPQPPASDVESTAPVTFPLLSSDGAATTLASPQTIVADTATGPEKPPTPPSPAPSPVPAVAPTTVSVVLPTPSAEGTPLPECSKAPETTATSTCNSTAAAVATTSQQTSLFGQMLASDKPPESIFTQPAVSTDSTTLGVSNLTSVISTAAPLTTPTPAPAVAAAAAAPAACAPAPSGGLVFCQPAAPTTNAPPAPAPAASGFGSTGFGSGVGATGFGKPVFGQVGGFGQPAASSASSGGFTFGQPAFGSSPAFGQPATAVPASSSGGVLFGSSSSSSSASSFSFGQMTTSSATTAGSSGLFGQSSTPAFGQQSSGFGQGSLFGAATTTAATGFSFGQPSAFGSTSTSSVFGQQTGGGSVFGQTAAPGGGLFGSGAGSSSGTSGSSGGFFSGLGGKPSEDAANKNPFGSTTSGDFGQSNQAGSSSLFGNSGAKTFGFGSSSFGEQKPAGTFSAGGGSVAAQGFGSFTSPAKPGGFGSAPVFGSPPAFGGSPSFGGTSAFGSGGSFSNPLGSTPSKVFGEGTAAANVGGFGFASASSAPSFGSLAGQNTPSFGNLAQQGLGFGGQSGGFSGFGPTGAFTGGFGSTNPSWRS